MNKKFKISMSLICLFAMLFCISSCDSEEEPTETEVVYHTVTFNTNGGSRIESIKIKHGTHGTAPANPTLENYVFCRWLKDNQPWFFDTKTINEDITLDALWISAESLFDIEPVGEGIGIAEIKQQKEFEELLIPSVINGKPVVAILDGACANIHEQHGHHIIFPSSITSIGADAFKEVTEPHLEFEGTITSIGESAFESCTTLEKIKLGSGMESIPFRVFAGCTSLKTINIPNGVKAIEENAFEECSSMLTIVFPATLESIENGAFDESAVKTVFFSGTEEQFDAIEIASGNDKILDAKVYFYSESEPTQDGDFWHYDKSGTPITW